MQVHCLSGGHEVRVLKQHVHTLTDKRGWVWGERKGKGTTVGQIEIGR